jgi:PTH1 family peptidyl-tRNA hydrolase
MVYTSDMKLIIGFGNPEARYDGTRHNIGFRMLDEFAQANDKEFKLKEKFRASIAEVIVNKEKVILAKPTTYYNLSGETFLLLSEFYKIAPADALVIHDELALPFGTIRARIGSSDAGNNGIKSINQRGGKESARLRIGISNDKREMIEDTAFVLGKFSSDEDKTIVKSITPKVFELIQEFIADKHTVTSHSLVENEKIV